MTRIEAVRRSAENRLKIIKASAYLDPVDVWDKSDFFAAVIVLCEGYQIRGVEWVEKTGGTIGYYYKEGSGPPVPTIKALLRYWIKKIKGIIKHGRS